MSQCELHGRGSAGRGANDRCGREVQRIEQTGMGIGLCGGGSVGRKRGAQVTEARHGDDAETATCQRPGKLQALVEAAAGAVYDQHCRAITSNRILYRTTGRLNDLTAGRNAFARLMYITSIIPVD
ncbi:hypothetical protein L0337_24175 [candidate division KSB1 bacterium]|nr:hypothetical protein [candidate division KSB1 bacterium]